MTRIFVAAMIAALACTPAYCQTPNAAESPQRTTNQADSPATMPLEPTAVPKWMGQAVDHILTGDDGDGRR